MTQSKTRAGAAWSPAGRRTPRIAIGAAVIAVALVLGGCGSSGNSAVSVPKVAPARSYALSGFEPAGPVTPGRPTTLSFTIQQPSGAPLTAYRSCCAPHEGVDLIIVRSDDSHVQYDDSDISPTGKVTQPVVFPTPGRYRVIIDAYPAHTSPGAPINFQLFTWVTVAGHYRPAPPQPYQPVQVVGGYRFAVQGHPRVQAIQATFLTLHVTDPHGRPAAFEEWRGALAHAIFIHQSSLDYFHTHVCAPGARYCTSALGAARVTGSSSNPGVLKVGVLLPAPGTWRMFLLTHLGGKYLTAPFTLNASS